MQYMYSTITDWTRYPLVKDKPLHDINNKSLEKREDGVYVYYSMTISDSIRKTTYQDVYKKI